MEGRELFERRTGIREGDYATLARVPLFTGLARPALQALLAESAVQLVPRGSILFMHGEPAERFFVVFDGWVKLFRDTIDGHESVIAVFSRGESFAEAAVFEEGVYPVSAAAAEEARVLSIPARHFMIQLRTDSDLALRMMASMSMHLRGLVRHIEQLTARSSTERLAGFLHMLCGRNEGSATIRLPLDKALIAARLGMQPETFSRSLARLKKLGVENRGEEIHVSEVAVLQDFCEGNSRV